MTRMERVAGLATYAERLAANDYLHENLLDAVENLRRAYGRASKRKAAAAEDEKFYRQLREAARSISEARAALLTGREKPKRSKKRVVLVVITGLCAGGAVALAANDDLREKVLGNGGETPQG